MIKPDPVKATPDYSKTTPFAASHRPAKHVGPGGNVTLPTPKNKGYKSDLPKMQVRHDGQCHGGEIRGAGIVHEMYKGPSALKVERLRHENIDRVWVGKRAGSVQPIVTARREAERQRAFDNATKWGVR